MWYTIHSIRYGFYLGAHQPILPRDTGPPVAKRTPLSYLHYIRIQISNTALLMTDG